MVPEIVLISAATVAVAVALTFALRFRGLVSVHELGIIEGSLPSLRQVLVVADHVEPPTDELRKAVEANFKRGVKYVFLISKSNADEEVSGYFGIFLAIAGMVQARQHTKKPITDFVEIKKLAHNWLDYPIIFYEVGSGPSGEDSSWFAYEGTDRKNGIADFYIEVPRREARRLAKNIEAEAPTKLPISAPQITEPAQVRLSD